MKIWTFSVIYNEAPMLKWFLRHYETFVDRMVFWDEHSTDGSRELIHAHPKAQLRDWPHRGLDDEQFRLTANYWPSKDGVKHGVDFVAFVDADELLYHPDPITALQTESADAVRSKGYALISATGWPQDDGRQIYQQVRTGVTQDNYSKTLWRRPGFAIDYSHGRHDIHCFDGRISEDTKWKLFHLHHVGGPQETKFRNQRNLNRAIDKKFAWAYEPKQEKLRTGGTSAWVLDAIKDNKLFDVMEDPI